MQENYTSRTDANHTPTNIIVNSSVERCVLAQPRHYICWTPPLNWRCIISTMH